MIDHIQLYGNSLSFFIGVTTEASNNSKADWLREIMNSLGRYNLFSNATTSQIQEHLSVKYRQFLLQQTGDEKLVKIAAKNVGLQEIEEDDYAVEELHQRRDAKLCVFNSNVHVTSSGLSPLCAARQLQK